MVLIMMSAPPEARPAAAGFGLRFMSDADGRLEERKIALAAARGTRFERVPPVPAPPPGQRGLAGLWWSSTMRDLVEYGTWLERDRVMMLDFSPRVTAFSRRPFCLTWRDGGSRRQHAPSYFARLADGTALVIDVSSRDGKSPRARVPAAAEEACRLAGWDYERARAVDAVLAANVRWLSGYRHPRSLNPAHAAALAAALERPAPLMRTAEAAGDPIAVLPTLYHMLWSGQLRADLESEPLGESTLVAAAGGDR